MRILIYTSIQNYKEETIQNHEKISYRIHNILAIIRSS